MDFHEESVHTGGHARSSEVRYVFRLPARALPLTAGKLQAVGDIEYDRTAKLLHDRKTAEIDDEIVIAK